LIGLTLIIQTTDEESECEKNRKGKGKRRTVRFNVFFPVIYMYREFEV
jgi:hypothetical protein